MRIKTSPECVGSDLVQKGAKNAKKELGVLDSLPNANLESDPIEQNNFVEKNLIRLFSRKTRERTCHEQASK